METPEQRRIEAVNYYLTSKHSLAEVVAQFKVTRSELFQTMVELRRPPPESRYGIGLYLAGLHKPPNGENEAE